MKLEHVDVIIIGAGLSGIGAACHLTRQLPNKTFAIMEGRDAIGGTWDLFRYPGVRSDSDMFTLGYNFKPWLSSQYLADGPSIRSYISEAARDYDIDKKIRFGVQVKSANWDSTTATWTLMYENKDSGEKKQISCNFVLGCTGYYNYKAGYEPEFKGRENFKGTIVHPQKWPEGLDYKGKKVVVIGSGATAITLVPEMSKDADHVTMLQRSPTYMGTVPANDKFVEKLQKYLPQTVAYRIARLQKTTLIYSFYHACQRFPKQSKKLVLGMVKRQLNEGYDMKHFTPSYNPWDQRFCAVKQGDVFSAIRKGQASIVTDHIERFTEAGILTKSGEELEADIIVTATGLDLLFFGGIEVTTDGKSYEFANQMAYKGVMQEGLPNIGFTFGYTNASWTLKADLTSEYFCRIIQHMDDRGFKQVVPLNDDPTVESEEFLRMSSGYFERAKDKMPAAGTKAPWKLHSNYALDLIALRYGKLNDGALQFSSPVGEN